MNKIEKIVEFYVRKYAKKFFNESYALLETLVEKKVQERLDLLSVLQEDRQPTLRSTMLEESHVSQNQTPKRKITPKDLGITDEVWKNVYADTLSSGNPILTEEVDNYEGGEPPADRPEHVPEAVLERLGLMQDFSKHMAAFDKIDKKKQTSSDDLEAYNKRREMLSKNIVREG